MAKQLHSKESATSPSAETLVSPKIIPMKFIYILFALLLLACSENAGEQKTSEETKPGTKKN